MLRDIVRAYRGLVRRPVFFLAVVLTLALGIGANSAIFSVIDAVLLKPLPYPGGDRLLAVYESSPRQKVARSKVNPARLEDWNRMNQTFTGIAGAYTESAAETSGSLPERMLTAKTSPRFFEVLGTPTLLGRGFNPEEEVAGGAPVVVISERIWNRRFHGDPQAIGKTLRFGNNGYQVVGVAPASFAFPSDDVDAWLPAQIRAAVMRQRDTRFYNTVGRVKSGVSPDVARADLAAVQARLAQQYPQTDGQWAAVSEPLKEETVGGVRRSLWILFGAVSLVLLIACANVAYLMLAQASRREGEIALRFSLGANRAQVVAELLREAVCAALPGALLGLLLAGWGAQWFQSAAAHLPRAGEIRLDWRIVAFTLVVCGGVTVLFGLLPALAATRRQMAEQLAQASRRHLGGRRFSLRLLVSAQIALALVLLVGAGLLIRTLSEMGRVPLGFQPDHVLALQISASFSEKNDMKRVQKRLARTLETLSAIPGIQAAALSLNAPGGATEEYPGQFSIAGKGELHEGEKMFADLQSVSPDYFQTLGIPMLAGSTCRINFEEHRMQPVLVNRAFRTRFLAGGDAVGQRLNVGPGPVEIVGVVGDIRSHGYTRDPGPVIYFCELPGYFPDPQYLVKTAGSPAAMVETVRRKMQSIEPGRAVYNTKPLSEFLAGTLAEKRFQSQLLSLFGLTALLLAAIGLYGVTSFLVTERRREMGLRAALGARPAQLLGHVARDGGSMAGVGIGLGLAAAVVLSRSMGSLLFGISPLDPVTFVAVPLVLVLVAAAAVGIPARRAMQADPMESLRQD
jgi:putative ABC transport system permease protein